MNQNTPVDLTPWKEHEKILFRFFFIYFLIQVLPLDWIYVAHLFSFGWLGLHYGDIFNLTRYSPKLFTLYDSFYNWAIAALVAVIGVAVWTIADQRSKEYNKLYFWLRVLVRYRLAVGIIGYGMIKLFPLQAPFPSISNLNTHYGDLSAWKIFSMSLGIVPGYESFLGLVEIIAGLLLLYRKTATIGAFIIAIFTGNVFMSNLAYEGGEHIYSLYLISLALFLLAYDAIGLYRLFGEEKAVMPTRYKPVFTAAWQQTGRYVAKAAFLLFFVVVYGFTTYSGAKSDPYQFPTTPGLADAAGIYDVTEFRINNKELPYSPTDSVRWKDVAFEKWATISIRSNRPVKLEHALVEQVAKKDEDRIYELAGSAGRHYYQYTVDAAQSKLLLQNKASSHAGEKLVFQFTRTSKDQIVLDGVNERADSLHVVLNRIPKKYLLIEADKGRNKPIKL